MFGNKGGSLAASMRTTGIIATAVAAALAAAAPAMGMETFDDAKRLLPPIHARLQSPRTLYCGCTLLFSINNMRYSPDLRSCGYAIGNYPKRATRIEAEHIMPAHAFGHQRPCWRAGGRKLCEERDSDFMEMEGDLHNLYPAVGEVNKRRSNYRFNDWNGQGGEFGQCEAVVDDRHRMFQPPERARGIVARAYLYMSERYGLSLSRRERGIFEAWDRMYPPDGDECDRNLLIQQVQGNDNPFVTRSCPL